MLWLLLSIGCTLMSFEEGLKKMPVLGLTPDKFKQNPGMGAPNWFLFKSPQVVLLNGGGEPLMWAVLNVWALILQRESNSI